MPHSLITPDKSSFATEREEEKFFIMPILYSTAYLMMQYVSYFVKLTIDNNHISDGLKLWYCTELFKVIVETMLKLAKNTA